MSTGFVANGKPDANRPIFHVLPKSGWLNDPNGPIYFDGLYHVFYQHIEGKPNWDWSMTWGHAASKDLVHWAHLPVALRPTKDGADSAGCWSGCCAVTTRGELVAIYTGVRLRGAPYDGPPSPPFAPNEPMIESIMVSERATADKCLLKWRPGTRLNLQPPTLEGVTLEGWRDPFVYKLQDDDSRCIILMGSGYVKDGQKNGCVMLYTAEDVTTDWQYVGILAEGNFKLGRVWECPALVQLLPSSAGNGTAPLGDMGAHTDAQLAAAGSQPSFVGGNGVGGKHLLMVGAYQSTDQNAGWDWDPVVYFIGDFDGTKLDMETASGPHRLDLGDAPYAPNVMKDADGQVVLWIWLREVWPDDLPVTDYCGCLSVPRLLTLRDGCLFQQPHPAVDRLRSQQLWSATDQSSALQCEGNIRLESCTALQMDLELEITRGSAPFAGLLLESGAADGVGSFMVVVDWEKDELIGVSGQSSTLLAITDASNIPRSDVKRIMQGPLSTARVDSSAADARVLRDRLRLRLLLDGSTVEVYTSTGQVMSTRVHLMTRERVCRLVTLGKGAASFTGSAWGMGTIWDGKALAEELQQDLDLAALAN